MLRIVPALLIWLGFQQPALAGAWMRAPGSGFTAVAGTVYRPENQPVSRLSFYGERGLAGWLTAGLDIDDYNFEAGHAILFARLPLYQPDSGGRLALELGAGLHHRQGLTGAMTKLTLSYGTGLDTGLGPGWLAVDAAAERRFGTNATLFKLDLTAGLSADRRVNPLLQIETAYTGSREFLWSATPALILRGRGGARWLIGVERRARYPEGFGLKLGLWRDF